MHGFDGSEPSNRQSQSLDWSVPANQPKRCQPRDPLKRARVSPGRLCSARKNDRIPLCLRRALAHKRPGKPRYRRFRRLDRYCVHQVPIGENPYHHSISHTRLLSHIYCYISNPYVLASKPMPHEISERRGSCRRWDRVDTRHEMARIGTMKNESPPHPFRSRRHDERYRLRIEEQTGSTPVDTSAQPPNAKSQDGRWVTLRRLDIGQVDLDGGTPQRFHTLEVESKTEASSRHLVCD
ncbi:hypothetical protein bAD24_III10525 [Burkholderia sp. AD24]|nr:hypothetical protein bAD24_III10525 [Burkholderia sp. AD24]